MQHLGLARHSVDGIIKSKVRDHAFGARRRYGKIEYLETFLLNELADTDAYQCAQSWRVQ